MRQQLNLVWHQFKLGSSAPLDLETTLQQQLVHPKQKYLIINGQSADFSEQYSPEYLKV